MIRQKITLIVIAALLIFVPFQTFAKDTPVPIILEHAPENQAAFKHILAEKITIEKFINEAMQPIRGLGDGTKITKELIDSIEKKYLGVEQQRQLTELTSFDLNLDAKLTREEIENALKRQTVGNDIYRNYPHAIKNQINGYFDLDTDKDGVISYKEMSTPREGNNVGHRITANQLKLYLNMDPNKDGTLDASELLKIALKVFDDVDRNKDTILTHDELPKIKVSSMDRIDIVDDSCSIANLEIPKDIIIYSAIASDSGKQTDFKIDNSGNNASLIEVTLTEQEKPVGLILASNDPTIWNISKIKNSKIVAILAGGYHKQMITGLDEKVPTIISTSENKNGCGDFYASSSDFDKISPASKQVFGQPPGYMYMVGTDGDLIVGPKNYDETLIVRSTNNTPEIVEESAPLSGKAALEAAIKRGFIRKAKQEDIDEWIKISIEQLKQTKRDQIPNIKDDEIYKLNMPPYDTHNTYVILKPYVIPDGLTGGNSVKFIVPKGVSMPKGDAIHCDIYDFNTGICTGPGFNCVPKMPE